MNILHRRSPLFTLLYPNSRIDLLQHNLTKGIVVIQQQTQARDDNGRETALLE